MFVATQLLDSAPAAEASPAAQPGAAPGPVPAPPQAEPVAARCGKCGAPLAPGQDWCLQCGAGAPGSVSGHGWRVPAVAVALAVLLVLGAAAAGWAALSKKARHAPVVTATVAQAPTPATPAPATTTPAPPVVGTPAAAPKIPLKAATPAPAVSIPASPSTTPTPTPTPKTNTGKSTTPSTGGAGAQPVEEPQSEALLLDTDAASTYNPYNYPAEWFGDPSLTIDGDTTTGWTAEVNPATAPKMAAGLQIDLKSKQRLAVLELVTSTPGLTVQVYGTQAKTPPASITDPAWVALSRSTVVAKHRARINLRNRKKAYRFVTLWISKAPESALGTPTAPGKVAIDEVELLPPR